MDLVWRRAWRGIAGVFFAAAAATGLAQAPADPKACGVVLVQSTSTSLGALARRLQTGCTVRTTAVVPSFDMAAHVRALRQQGAKRVVMIGHGAGANTAIAYAGDPGDIDAVIAVGASSAAGELPSVTPKIKQHIPMLWLVGTGDAIAKMGEDYAYGKAPPHPSSRYVELKGDAGDAAGVKVVMDWLKGLD